MIRASSDPDRALRSIIDLRDKLEIYTDGSKSKNSPYVGLACICPSLDTYINRSISKEASIFTAESKAISHALDLALENTNRDIMIFSDSLSVLRSLLSPHVDVKTSPYV
ncbi:hypothetical protein QAD02_019114 [Eretmocerus hayati]|uniref:Uncharacterized protein n=1 Tax=Eretmocerus hayati TaxID=131215 RepID=A0ACC2PLR9_9HYME|nr:hypothetical protein QAD02_019114 [Eretmocerus hayati]